MIKCGLLESTCVVDLAGRKSNLALVMARGLPSCKQMSPRTDPLAIVASGPSVVDHLDELRSWPGAIWAINGAYDWLQDQQIIADGFFAIDPLPGLADYVSRPQRKTTFYIASVCDPSVFDALTGHNVELFHPVAEDVEYSGQWQIGGGTTALTRAPWLALLLGFREITMFGCDSSFAGREYCYDWGRYACDIDQPKMWVEMNGEGPFETEIGLLKQVSQLGVMVTKFNGMLKVRCGGLMDAFLRAPTMDDSNIEIENEPIADADAA